MMWFEANAFRNELLNLAANHRRPFGGQHFFMGHGLKMERRRFLQTIAAGLTTAAFLPSAWATPDYHDPRDVYATLSGPPDLQLYVKDGHIAVKFAKGPFALDHDRVAAWVHRCAVAVSTYFGRFPVDHVGLLLVPIEGSRIGPATTYGFAGSATCLYVGADVDDAVLMHDWVLVHEMVHLALPEVPRRSSWFLEGNATYIEPIARAQAGQMTPQEVWRWALDDMDKGQPGPGDQGLDHTHTWGRTYWGGAMYWLLAEVAIYQKTAGRHRVQDAVRAINRASGGNTAFWSVEQVAKTGDLAVDVDVLASLYESMKDQAVHVDLDRILRQLGVAEVEGKVVFDERAPLAALRRWITTAPSQERVIR